LVPDEDGRRNREIFEIRETGGFTEMPPESAADGRSKAHAGGVLPVRALAPAFLPGFIGPEALGETLESVKGR